MNDITLKAARINKKLSARQVAEHLNVSQDTVYRWEAGKGSPNINQALKMAKLYEVPIDVLDFSLNEGSE